MRYLISFLFIIIGIIHLMPLTGALGGEYLSGLYGLTFADPNLQILMRHRAVLFGLLGIFFIFAAFQHTYQPLAFIAGFISVLSYLGLALSIGGYNAELGRVFYADVIALGCLVVALMLFRQNR
jgi:hypothetical protein